MSQQERIRVAIVGAGIVGVTLAVALNTLDKDHKIAIDIYEAAPELGEIGAGINVWPRTWEMFKKIGLGDLVPFFDHDPDLEPRIIFGLRKGDQKNGFKIHDVMNDGGALRIHRADLQRNLIEHLPLPGTTAETINSTCTLHLCHRLVDYTYSQSASSGPITLHFDGKPSTTCDILVGADGIKSSLRRIFLERLPNPQEYTGYLDPKWSGLVAYRGLISKEELQKVSPENRALEHPGLMYVGKDKYTVIYPVSGGKLLNIVAIVREAPDKTPWEGPWRLDVSQQEFLDVYGGWDEDVHALISCVKQPTKWALHHLNHLSIFAKGRVFLMGDAAHAMLPHLGAGASVGIEDAYVLASLLTDPSTPRVLSTQFVNRLTDIYNTVRVPPAISMSKATIETGYLCHLMGPNLEEFKEGDDIPEVILRETARAAGRNWAWTNSDPEQDRRTAVELLGAPRVVL